MNCVSINYSELKQCYSFTIHRIAALWNLLFPSECSYYYNGSVSYYISKEKFLKLDNYKYQVSMCC